MQNFQDTFEPINYWCFFNLHNCTFKVRKFSQKTPSSADYSKLNFSLTHVSGVVAFVSKIPCSSTKNFGPPIPVSDILIYSVAEI